MTKENKLSSDIRGDFYGCFFDALGIFEKIINNEVSKKQTQNIENPDTKKILRLFLLFKKKYNTNISSLIDDSNNVNEEDVLNLLEFLSKTVEDEQDFELYWFVQYMKNELEENLYSESIDIVNEEIKQTVLQDIESFQKQIMQIIEENQIQFIEPEENKFHSLIYKFFISVFDNIEIKELDNLFSEIVQALNIKKNDFVTKKILKQINNFVQGQIDNIDLDKTENLTVPKFVYIQISKSWINKIFEDIYIKNFGEKDVFFDLTSDDIYPVQKKSSFLLNNPERVLSSSEKKSNVLYVNNQENIYYKVFNSWDVAFNFLKLNVLDVFKSKQSDKTWLLNEIKKDLDSKWVYSDRLKFFDETSEKVYFFSLKIAKKQNERSWWEYISVLLEKESNNYKQSEKSEESQENNDLAEIVSDSEALPDSGWVLRFESFEEDEITKQVAVIKISDYSIINRKYWIKLWNLILQKISNIIQQHVQKYKYLELEKLSTLEFAIVNKKNSDETIEDLFEEIFGSRNATEWKFYIKEIWETVELDFNYWIYNNEDNLDLITAFEKALMAMYYAKKNWYWTYYSPEIEEQEKEGIENYLNWKRIIKQALKENSITPFLQWIYDAKEDNLLQYEALMRLYNAESQEIYSPWQFMDYLHQFDKDNKAFLQVVIKSINYIKNDSRKKIFLNFTSEQLKNLKIYKIIQDLLNSHNINWENITIEIPEETLEQNIDFIDKYKELGIKIAIDDFGKWYSNLKKLFELSEKIDFLKVDGSIIKWIADDKSKQETLNLIMFFSSAHNFQVVVEFIETQRDYEYLKDKWVRYFQGFLFSKPQPIEDRFIKG